MEIRCGMLRIPCLNINFVNSKYSVSPLHQFSKCCNERVGNKKYCKGCGEEVLSCDIQKGTDSEHILTEEQQERLKTLLDNSTINLLSIQEKTENTLYDLIPLIQKSQIVLPKLEDKRINLQMFNSFKKALKNKYAIAKMITRGTEHLVILTDYKNDLIMVEIPFNKYLNTDEIKRLQEATKIEESEVKELDKYDKEAIQFVNSFNKEQQISKIKEEKKELMKTFLEQVNKPFKEDTPTIEEENPFSIVALPKK